MRWVYRHPSFYNVVDSLFSAWLSDRVRKKVLASLEPSSLLEIGIGSGKNMKLLVSPLRVGVDTSREMLKYTKSTYRDVKVIIGDAAHLPVRDVIFEVSVFCYVLRGLRKPLDAVREALRVSSKVIIIDYDRPYLLPRVVWDKVINRFSYAVYGSRDLDFAALEELGASKRVFKYYCGLYRVIELEAAGVGKRRE